jgi:hypothetical protein
VLSIHIIVLLSLLAGRVLEGGDHVGHLAAGSEGEVGGEGLSRQEAQVVLRVELRVEFCLGEGSQELRVDERLLPLDDDVGLDLGHLQLVLLPVQQFAQLDALD